MSDFSKNLCALIKKQYEDLQKDGVPSKSVLYAESREKLEKASGEIENHDKSNAGTEKEKGGIVGDYVKLYKAYAQAMSGDETSIFEYLDIVFDLLNRDDKSKKEKQLWVPSNKDNLETKNHFYTDIWRPLLSTFIDKKYLPESDDSINRQWIQKVFRNARDYIGTAGVSEKETDKKIDTETKQLVITKMHNNLKAGFIYGDVDSNLSNLLDNKRISTSLLNRCVDDEFFESLFSVNGKKTPHKVLLEKKEKNFDLFFRIMENGSDENIVGSEQYRYLLIPLYVDSFTGVSMCIVGRNYFYDKKSFLPCILQVMKLSDVGQRKKNGMSEIYEPVYTYNKRNELKPLHKVYLTKNDSDEERQVSVNVRREVCRNYFEYVYANYRAAKREAVLLLREIDVDNIKGFFTKKDLPEEIMQSPFYKELSIAQGKIEKSIKKLREKGTNA